MERRAFDIIATVQDRNGKTTNMTLVPKLNGGKIPDVGTTVVTAYKIVATYRVTRSA